MSLLSVYAFVRLSHQPQYLVSDWLFKAVARREFPGGSEYRELGACVRIPVLLPLSKTEADTTRAIAPHTTLYKEQFLLFF